MKVVRINAPPEWAADPNLAIPTYHRCRPSNPDTKLIAYPGGQLLGNAPAYMEAAGKKPGEIINIGFDTSPQSSTAFKNGWVQLTSDQQPFLQGYMPILVALPAGRLRPRRDERRHRRRLRDARELQGGRRPRDRGLALSAQSASLSSGGRPRPRTSVPGRNGMGERLIELKGVTKSYGRVFALGGVDLHVDRGEVVGLIGDNGAGKSTLIKILAGVVKPTAGEILIRGEPVSHWNGARSRDAGIETVFQDRALCRPADDRPQHLHGPRDHPLARPPRHRARSTTRPNG